MLLKRLFRSSGWRSAVQSRVGEFVHRLAALGQVSLQAGHDGFLDRRRELQALHGLVQRDRRLREELLEQLAGGAAGVRQRAGQQVVGDGGQAVDVRLLVDQLSGERLRGHVLQRAHEEPGPGQALLGLVVGVPRDPEVQQHRALGGRGVHDVGRLEVAVDDAQLVCRAQGGTDLLDDRRHQFGSQVPGADGELLQGLAVDPLQGEVVQILGLAVVVGLDDVRVADPRAELGFTQEALDGHRVLGQSGCAGP